MKKFTFLAFILIMSFLFSCKKNEITPVNDNDYLIFGHYYKDCEGEKCIETFLLSEGKLYEDLSDSYSREVHFNFVELSNEEYKSTSDLLESFPKELLKDRRHSFGCPDCYGQGGLYIAYKKDGELKSWNIDPIKKNDPPYLYNFIDDVINKLSHLNK